MLTDYRNVHTQSETKLVIRYDKQLLTCKPLFQKVWTT